MSSKAKAVNPSEWYNSFLIIGANSGNVIQTVTTDESQSPGDINRYMYNLLHSLLNVNEKMSFRSSVRRESLYFFRILAFFQDLCYTGPVGSLMPPPNVNRHSSLF
jgi:hypothetical protein